MSSSWTSRALAHGTLAAAVALAPAWARADEPGPTAAPAPAPPAEPTESKISSPGLVAGGAAVGIVGLGTTGLGVYLTAKGSTLDCIECDDSNDEAPLVAGGLGALVLGLGMAAAGGTMVILGFRDAPLGVRVAEVHVQPGGASLVGSF